MKKLTKVIAVFLAVCFLMTSCYTTQNVLLTSQELRDRYIGKTGKEIIQMMGPPTRETTDGDDGAILIYEENGGSTTKTTYDKYLNTTYYKTTQNPDKYAWFYLDSKGVCTYVKTNCLTKRARAYDPGLTAGVVVLSTLGVGLIVLYAFTAKYL